MEQYKTINRDKQYVMSLQQEIGVKADGIYGNQTHAALKAYHGSPMIIHNGKPTPIDSPIDINWSLPLYELDDGSKNWYNRKSKITSICVHWGGLNTRHCYNVFNVPKGRHVSSHFLIGKNSKTNEYEILQCLDTGLVAYHAGYFNKSSIGVDICMHPDTKYWEKTKKWYEDAYIDTIQHEDPRVNGREAVMIGDEFAQLCQEFLASLREATGLTDTPVCKTSEVMSIPEAKKYSIVGHHNVSAKKWDVIHWAEKVYHNI